MIKKTTLLLAFIFGYAFSAPLLMLDLESNVDSNITELWERTIIQILKEASFEPVKVSQENFKECSDIDCVISAARASGAQGLFRGRLRLQGNDSVNIRMQIDWLAGSSNPQTSVQSVVPFTWDDVLKEQTALKLLYQITGKSFDIKSSENKNHVISVQTNPENAVVMLNENTVCYSPCSFTDSSDIVQISAYYSSGTNLWAAKTTTKLTGDTTKIFLELKRSFASTEIRTNPGEALVLTAEPLNINSKAIGKTPYILYDLPGKTQLRLFSEGYNDTLIDVKIDAIEKQFMFVELTPIKEPERILYQNTFIKSQTKKQIGLGLLGGSIVPLAAGILTCVFAQDDYQTAKDIKNKLNYPSIGNENFKARVKENHRAVEQGDLKTVVGTSLIGLSVLLASVGFSMSF